MAMSAPRDSLAIYFIDVEGGQATLFVSPSGESMLVDTGWPGFNGRDAVGWALGVDIDLVSSPQQRNDLA